MEHLQSTNKAFSNEMLETPVCEKFSDDQAKKLAPRTTDALMDPQSARAIRLDGF